MNYNVYLFSCLLKIYDKKFKKLEYDKQFKKVSKLYREFESSDFNNTTKGEYECILAYLKDKYPNKEKKAIVKKIKSIMKEFGSFTTSIIQAETPILIPSKDNLIHLAKVFCYSHCNVDIYEQGENWVFDYYKLRYNDMDIDTLNKVLLYVEEWEAMRLQDEDRQTSM